MQGGFWYGAARSSTRSLQDPQSSSRPGDRGAKSAATARPGPFQHQIQAPIHEPFKGGLDPSFVRGLHQQYHPLSPHIPPFTSSVNGHTSRAHARGTRGGLPSGCLPLALALGDLSTLDRLQVHEHTRICATTPRVGESTSRVLSSTT